jgi:DNA primase large subunit
MIPNWVVVKHLSDTGLPKERLQLDMDEWPEIAKVRMERFARGDKWFPTKTSTIPTNQDAIFEEFAGHGLLRLVAADNRKIASWLIEQEGDLFEWRFKKTNNIQLQIEIIRFLFDGNRVKTPRETWALFDIHHRYFKSFIKKQQSTIAIHFTCVPKLVTNRSAILTKGWVVAPIEQFTNSVKTEFENTLNKRIISTGKKMDRTARSAVKELRDEIGKTIHTFAKRSGDVDYSSYELYHRQDIFPQCMLDLYSEVMEKGHLGHEERFQLGLFLKKLGMTIDDQLHFWYSHAIDNAGLSFNEFSRGQAGYIIRHMYGLKGGETDYNVPNCETIQDSYYCSFLHQSLEAIDEKIRQEFKDPPEKVEQAIQALERKVINKKPSEACAILFSLRYHRACRPIWHPINYTTYAAKVKKIIKQSEKENERKSSSNRSKE